MFEGWNPAGAACNRGAAVEADAIGEQQLTERMRSGAAAEADASGEHAAAAEVGAIGEQQAGSGRKRGAAVAIGPGSSS